MIKMFAEEIRTQNNEILAEKCKMALEKSFGIPVPMPNCLSRKHRMFRR
jgi:hypothetical protein